MTVRVLSVFGTRPEAIKLAPLVPVLRARGDVARRDQDAGRVLVGGAFDERGELDGDLDQLGRGRVLGIRHEQPVPDDAGVESLFMRNSPKKEQVC